MFKKIIGLVLLVYTCISNGAIVEVQQPIEHLFVPEGYDTDDSVQVVATGTFKNSCFQVGPVESEVDLEAKEITLTLTAYQYETRCLQVEVPFFQTIYLGRINKSGEYRVVDGTDGRTVGTLKIGKPSEGGSGTDDIPYANVTDAFLVGDQLHLRGIFSNSCLRVKNIELRYQEGVLVVLPYLELVTSNETACAKSETPFELTEPISKPLPRKFLLHARSMGGQAINKIVVR